MFVGRLKFALQKQDDAECAMGGSIDSSRALATTSVAGEPKHEIRVTAGNGASCLSMPAAVIDTASPNSINC